MTAPTKQDGRPIAFDPTLYQKREYDVSYTQLARQVLDNQKPTGDTQWASGYLLICLTLLAGYKMYLSHKSGSPSAKAEKDLKLDLINEMSLFKDTLNSETIKRNRFVDSRINDLNLNIANVNKDITHNTEAIHDLQRDNRERYETIIKLLSKTP